jgi:hypothetical protein
MRRLMMAVCFVVSAVAVVLASGCGGDANPTGNTSPNSKQVMKDKR